LNSENEYFTLISCGFKEDLGVSEVSYNAAFCERLRITFMGPISRPFGIVVLKFNIRLAVQPMFMRFSLMSYTIALRGIIIYP